MFNLPFFVNFVNFVNVFPQNKNTIWSLGHTNLHHSHKFVASNLDGFLVFDMFIRDLNFSYYT